MTVSQDVLANVTGTWSTAAEINKRMGVWSVISTRFRLNQLADDGKIMRRMNPHAAPGRPNLQYRMPCASCDGECGDDCAYPRYIPPVDKSLMDE